MQDWRIQYGNLSKNKLTVADWVNCGNVIFKLTTYLEIIATLDKELKKAYDEATAKFDEADSSQSFLGYTYVQVRYQKILSVP